MSLKRKDPASVRFGWSCMKPPKTEDYRRRLSVDSLKQPVNMSDPQPSEALVKDIAAALSGGLDKPRFVALTGSKALFKDIETAKGFQVNLVNALLSWFKNNNPDFLTSYYTFKQQAKIPVELLTPVGNMLGSFSSDVNFHWEGGGLDYDKHDGFDSVQQPPLFSILYEFSGKMTGGIPILADLAQLLEDTKDSKKKVFNYDLKRLEQPEVEIENKRRKRKDQEVTLWFALQKVNDRLYDHYSFMPEVDLVNDWPLLILNNGPNQQGILHSGTPGKFKSEEAYRHLWRVRALPRIQQ